MTQVCGTGTWGTAPKPGDPDNNSILTAKPAFGGIDVMWTFPEVNPHGVAYVNLYRGTSGEVAHAVRHAVVNGNYFYDKITTDTSIRYFYWIEIVSVNGTHGDLIGPASAIARPTIEQIMDDLTAQIDAGMLSQTLKQRLDRIELVDHRIADEILERARSIATLGDSIALLQTEVDGAVSAIFEETTQRQDAHEAFVGQLNLMFASLDGSITAAIQSERQARVSADSAITESIDIMYATLGDDIEAAVLSERKARTDSQSAMATSFDALVAQTAEDLNAAIQTESTVRSDAVEAVTTQLTILESRVNDDVFAAINTERQARADGHEALTTEITTLGSKFEGDLLEAVEAEQTARIAAVQSEQTARSTAVDALASAIQTTQAELGDDIALARTQLTTMVDEVEDTVGAMWTAQVDVNGMVGGFGIMNDGQQVEAGFNVNRFWVGKTDDINGIKRYPFIIENDEVMFNGPVKFSQVKDLGSLASRDNVTLAHVTNAGSLASKNSLSYTEVTGTKPPTNADRTASNTSYDTSRVAGVSAATVLARANNGNAANSRINEWVRPDTTLIDGNKIYTGDAYVDTLQIKGQAVTVPVSRYTVDSIEFNGGWVTAQTITVNLGRVPVQILASVRYKITSKGGGEGTGHIRVLHGGSVIWEGVVANSPGAVDLWAGEGGAGSNTKYFPTSGVATIAFQRYLGSGNQSFTLQVRSNHTITDGTASHRYINVLGLKR